GVYPTVAAHSRAMARKMKHKRPHRALVRRRLGFGINLLHAIGRNSPFRERQHSTLIWASSSARKRIRMGGHLWGENQQSSGSCNTLIQHRLRNSTPNSSSLNHGSNLIG